MLVGAVVAAAPSNEVVQRRPLCVLLPRGVARGTLYFYSTHSLPASLPFLPPFARRALCYAVLLLAVVALGDWSMEQKICDSQQGEWWG